MESSLRTLLDLFGRLDFLAGVCAGAAAWLLTSLLSATRKGWGIALTAATVGGVNVVVDRRLGSAVGLAILGVGGAILERRSEPTGSNWKAWGLISLGAFVTSLSGGLPDLVWVQIVTPIVIVTMGYHLCSWTELRQHRLLGPMALITAFGIWITVPDTDAARVLLGASAALSAATVFRNGLRLTPAGAFAVAGTFVWISTAGGGDRHGSIIGAWACMGLLLVLPLLGDRAPALPDRYVLTVHVAFVLIASRVLGMLDAAAPVALGVLTMGGLTYVGLRVLATNSEGLVPGAEHDER